MDNKGQVKEVRGIKELVNNMIEKGGFDEETKATVLQAMEGSLNEENMATNFSYGFGFFPENAIGVGETWTNSTNLGSGMEGSVKSTYTVKAINGNNMDLEVQSDVAPTGKEGLNMKGKQNGTVTVDTQTGLTSKMTSTRISAVTLKPRARICRSLSKEPST